MTLTGKLFQMWQDRRSTVAVIFALAGMTLFSMVALAVDFGGAVDAKSKLVMAADAALLATAASATNQFKAEPGALIRFTWQASPRQSNPRRSMPFTAIR